MTLITQLLIHTNMQHTSSQNAATILKYTTRIVETLTVHFLKKKD